MLSPDLLAKIRRIEIGTRRKVGSFFAGHYTSVFRGQGMTFLEVRPYQPGDDIRRIDWNVSARMREPYIKQFVEEREMTVALLVDVSQSLHFGTRKTTKLKLAAELAALFSFLAIKHNDRVALIAFSDHIEKMVPPKKGRQHVLRLTNDIMNITPKGQGTNWQEAFKTTKRVIKRHAVVFVISDFIGLNDASALKALAATHDVIPLWIRDPMEQSLPQVGLLPVLDPETGEEYIIDTNSVAHRRAYESHIQQQRDKVERIFQSAQIRPVEIVNGTDYTQNLLKYFRMRAMQR